VRDGIWSRPRRCSSVRCCTCAACCLFKIGKIVVPSAPCRLHGEKGLPLPEATGLVLVEPVFQFGGRAGEVGVRVPEAGREVEEVEGRDKGEEEEGLLARWEGDEEVVVCLDMTFWSCSIAAGGGGVFKGGGGGWQVACNCLKRGGREKKAVKLFVNSNRGHVLS
jgi:hypothetical protein